ncbi:MAG: hypothetical protein R2822_23045 [Spirosomataceae bacterium]
MKRGLCILMCLMILKSGWSNTSLRTYRVTLEKITLIKSETTNGSENLYGSVWAGVYCNSNDNQAGASFDSRERTLKFFERNMDKYVKISTSAPLLLNQSLVFDLPTCEGNKANFTLTASLGNQSSNRQYLTEQHRVYLSEINGSLRRTLHCYERGSHIEVSFTITQL